MKTIVLIDGGYLRAAAKGAGKVYDNAFIVAFSRLCMEPDEYLMRVIYYDAPQFRGTVQLPVSGQSTTFQASDAWLNRLAQQERFAVRRGTLGFRGWQPKTIPIAGAMMTDSDFAPIFEQKGVDMRIGLDIAALSQTRTAERIILVSGDQDMIPAMKLGRRSGLEVALIQLAAPTKNLHDDLTAHADFVRPAGWP